MAPTVLGIDASHHQGALDWKALRAAEVQFAGLKATEGDGFIDSRFAANLAGCRAAGVIPYAYHYQRSVATAAEQVALIRRVVPRDVSVAVDVEAGSGGIGLTRGIVAGLRAAGYYVPLSYIPRWYHQQLGFPSLAGLPPLWSSRYPDYVIHELKVEYREVDVHYPHYWNGYGGLPVAVLQFTSSARVAGRAPLDGNAYRGTVPALRALLTGHGPTPPKEGPLAGLTDAQQTDLYNKVKAIEETLAAPAEWTSRRWSLGRVLSAMRNDDIGTGQSSNLHARLTALETNQAEILNILRNGGNQ